MRALVHIGLAALLVVAPALCCCNLGLLTRHAGAATRGCPSCESADLPAAPQPADPKPACCQSQLQPERPGKMSCCGAVETPADPAPRHDHGANAPAKPQPTPFPGKCQCCGERPAATSPEAAPAVADPEPTGERLPLAVLRLTALPPEHLGLLGGLRPPERAGVDARSESLFSRHVLRC